MAPSRLLQNSRRRPQPSSAASSASGSGRQHGGAADELPPYEPPSQPLNDAARRALAQISNNRSTRKYDDHMKKSSELIRDAVGATNDRAWDTYSALQQRTEKLAQTGQDKTEADLELEEYAVKLGDSVGDVTGKLEASLREIIDYRVELQDEPAVLETVSAELESQAQTWRPRQAVNKVQKKASRPVGDDSLDAVDEDEDAQEDEDGEDPEMREPGDSTPVTGANEVLQRVRQSKTEDWTQMDMGQRYASHNDYIIFKRTLHDAQHPNEDATIPHASAWFGPDGQPVLSKVGEIDGPGEADEDDELQIAGAKESFRCPLSLQIMQEPYSSHKCRHSFEKKSIIEYIGKQGSVQCPQSGCAQVSPRCPLQSDVGSPHG